METTLRQSHDIPVIVLKNKACECQIYQYGAHIVSFTVDGIERLWMSRLSAVDGSAPIQGGIPVCFPQFANEGCDNDQNVNFHGFAREFRWEIVEMTEENATLQLRDNEETFAIWPRSFRLLYQITLLERGLATKLRVTNREGRLAWSFTGGVGTFFRFDDTSRIELLGFKNSTYIDKVDSGKKKVQRGAVNVETETLRTAKHADIKFGYVDRIYLNSPNELKFRHLTKGRSVLKLSHSPSWPDLFLYNPWLGDKQGDDCADFDDIGYRFSICCAPMISRDNSITLSPGESWEGSQTCLFSECPVKSKKNKWLKAKAEESKESTESTITTSSLDDSELEVDSLSASNQLYVGYKLCAAMQNASAIFAGNGLCQHGLNYGCNLKKEAGPSSFLFENTVDDSLDDLLGTIKEENEAEGAAKPRTTYRYSMQ